MKQLFSKKITTIVVVLAAMFMTGAVILSGPTTFATTAQQNICEGIGVAGDSKDCTDPAGGSIDSLVKKVVDIFSRITGIAAVIMIIVAGVKYTTSRGDSNAVSSAKNTLVYAIIGIVVVIFAQVIVKFTIQTSIDTTEKKKDDKKTTQLVVRA